LTDFFDRAGLRAGASLLATILLTAMLSVQALASEYEMCGLGPVRSVSLSGCDVSQCSEAGFVSQVLGVGDFRVGGYLMPELVPVGLERIRKLGFFTTAEVECVFDGEGVDVTVEVRPAVRIASIKFKGNRHFWRSDLSEKLSLRVGDAFELDDKFNLEQLNSARNSIEKEYQKEGFTGTEVDVEVEQPGKYSVNIVVTIREGKRIKIKDIVYFMHPASDIDLKSIDVPPGVEDCPVVRHSDLVSWGAYRRGSPMTEKTEAEIIRGLTQKLRSIGFSGVRIKPEFNRESGVMSVDVSWESCWLLRFYGRDEPHPGREGFETVESEALLEKLSFDDAGIFDISEASRGRAEIKTWYEDRGYLFADVVMDYRTRTGPAPTSQAFRAAGKIDVSEFGPGVAGRISYFITTGRKAEIREIRISGNESIGKADILSVMTTKPYDFFGSSGSVLPDQVLIDLEKIRSLYRDRGYPEMRFVGVTDGPSMVTRERRDAETELVTYANSQSAFSVEVLDDTEGVYLNIAIDEGKHTQVGFVAIEGNRFLTYREISEMMGLNRGGDFSPAIMNKALRALARRYSREGFLGAQIKLSCEGFNPDVSRSDCDPATVKSDVLNIFLEIEEGRQTMVGEVFVEGAVKTVKSVILKDMPRPGDPYDVEGIAKATRYLNNLGIFESVRVDAIGVDEKPPRDRAALVVRVREAKSKFLDFAVGLEKLDSTRASDMPAVGSSIITNTLAINDISNTGFGRGLGLDLPDILVTFEMRYSDINFLGRAKRLYLPVKYGLSFTAWDRYASFTPTYLDPNFFARGLMFRVTPYAEYDRATRALDRIQIGSEFAISKELYRHLFASLSFDTGGVRTRNPQVSKEYDPWRYENKLIPALTYDGLDHPINPTKGFFGQASFSYINDVSEGNYLKWEFSGKAFFSVRKLVTFGLVARIGGSKSFSATGDLPLEERYTLGGNRGLRGFSTDGVAQYGEDGNPILKVALEPVVDDNGKQVVDVDGNPIMGKKYFKPFGGDVMISGSFEMRFPIIRKVHFFGAVFYDFGALSESFSDLIGPSFRHSVGIGIRYMLAGTVPIRLDYGFILDRRYKSFNAETGRFEKMEEIGNFHFGILYTF